MVVFPLLTIPFFPTFVHSPIPRSKFPSYRFNYNRSRTLEHNYNGLQNNGNVGNVGKKGNEKKKEREKAEKLKSFLQTRGQKVDNDSN